MKSSFYNDYSEGAHPAILKLIGETNFDQEDGYGNDRISQRASQLVRQALQSSQAEIHFVSGGTQANLIVLGALLRPFESVIAANTAHIEVHEAGAIEATGHKINQVESRDGKLSAGQIQAVVDRHTDEHMVKPGAVFISHSSELGTIYLKRELQAISACCRQNGLALYLDGARLGSALTSREADLSLAELCELVDVFYIGGTKNGALLGEAIVIREPQRQAHFRHHLKQRGALLAKGRLLGVQFAALFEDGLYFELARHANQMAERLAAGLSGLGFAFLAPPQTNQLFPVLPDALIAGLQALYGFYVWAPAGPGCSAIRLVTSWATPPERVDGFLEDVKRLLEQQRGA
jgi:threonine aldolase